MTRAGFYVGTLLLSMAANQIRWADSADEDTYCAVRVTRFLLGYHGNDLKFSEMVADMKEVSTAGVTSLQGIVDTLRTHQLAGEAVAFESVCQLAEYTPCIIHLNRKNGREGHYVVLVATTDRMATIWDGLEGVTLQPTEYLDSQASGGAVLVTAALGGAMRPPCHQWWESRWIGFLFILLWSVSGVLLFRKAKKCRLH